MYAVAMPLLHLPPAATAVSWDCGPGYHKPMFGRCVPDQGVPLYRTNRYAAAHGTQHSHARLMPLRSMAPWGPNVRG